MINIMMPREQVEEKLRMKKSLAYKLFPPTCFGGKVKIISVIAALKLAACNGAVVGDYIPSDLMTKDEASEMCGVSVRSMNHQINIGRIPCFVFSRKHVLISRKQLEDALLVARRTHNKKKGK